MSDLTFSGLRAANVRRVREIWHHEDEWTPTDWATAFGGEAGEALNEVKKLRRATSGTGGPFGPYSPADAEELIRKVGDELADAILYADLLAARLGLDLGECIRRKFNVTSAKWGSRERL